MAMLPLLLSLAAAAQAPSVAPSVTTAHHRGMFISPMGEPFRPNARDDDTLADWFNQADRNHDGRLPLEEMQADAERFFAALDVDHDGEIGPDEISRYETTIAPESVGGHFSMMEVPGGDSNRGQYGGHHRGGGHRRGGGGSPGFSHGNDNDQHQGAGRFGLLDLPEPVIAADTNFNRGVSLAEFRDAAAQRFMALDLDRRGYLTLSSLEMIRPAPPAAPKAPKRPTDESALPDDGA